MKRVELSDEAFAKLQQLAAAKNLSPAEVIDAMLTADRPPLAGDNLLFFLASTDFISCADPAGRYLALLAWCAKHYPGDFADFISHQESGRRYLMLSREEFNETRTRNHARQIDGTQFWAVITISDGAKRRFVCRLLEYVGCHDETVAHACQALGLAESPAHGFRLLSA